MAGSGRCGASTRVGELLRRVAAFSFAAIAGSAFAAEADDSRILYFEPLRLSGASPSTQRPSTQQKGTKSRELQFDAYGRRFVLSLQTNEKLSPLLQSKTGIAPLELYKGQLNGVAGSWARIGIADGQLRGMVWDGSELYVIEPVSKLSDSLPADVPVSADTTAIFRLKDVLMKSDAASCGTDANAVAINKGNESYDSLLNELKSAPAIMQASGATRRLELAALGDMLFVNRYGTEAQARAEILLRLNNVDGIYSSQLGVEIQVPTVDIGDSLSETTSASSLLDELGNLRKRSPNLYSRGLTHLFTGRNLDGTTVGIAYLDSLCAQRYGAGLTEASSRSSWVESLIAAHEIGHNFGAPHDGEANTACASTPTGQFLMSPSINGNDDFSTCSLDVIRPRVTTSSCITALPAADIAIEPDFGVLQQSVGRSFDWNIAVSNVGGLTTTNARAEIFLPPVVTVQEAFVIGGSCVSGAGVITCQLGQIAGGSSTAINLILRSDVVGTSDVSIRVSATNEAQTSNNNGSATIEIEAEADLGIGLRAPTSVTNGTPFDVTLTATNVSGTEARDVTVALNLPAGVTASAATLNGTNCSVQNGAISCSLASLASGATVTGTASLVASTDGNAVLEARIGGGYIDPVAGNDTASATVAVTTPAATLQSSSSGGGGGSSSASLLWALLALLGVKNFQRGRAR
jgi:hypothetical protein